MVLLSAVSKVELFLSIIKALRCSDFDWAWCLQQSRGRMGPAYSPLPGGGGGSFRLRPAGKTPRGRAFSAWKSGSRCFSFK